MNDTLTRTMAKRRKKVAKKAPKKVRRRR